MRPDAPDTALGHAFRQSRSCCARRSPIAASPPITTNGSNSSATACSTAPSRACSTTASRSCRRVTCRGCARAWSTATRCTGTPSALGLGAAIQLGEGEIKSGGAARPSILADALEAVLGAIFLDGGYAAAHAAIERIYAADVAGADTDAIAKDPEDAAAGMAAGPAPPRARVRDRRRPRRGPPADFRGRLPHRRARHRGHGHAARAVAPPSRPRRRRRMHKRTTP